MGNFYMYVQYVILVEKQAKLSLIIIDSFGYCNLAPQMKDLLNFSQMALHIGL
jgi:hypothetical protein